MNVPNQGNHPLWAWRRHPSTSSGSRGFLVFVVFFAVVGMAAWFARQEAGNADRSQSTNEALSNAFEPSADNDRFHKSRRDMIERHLRQRDITDPRVLEVMQRVPRHLFVPDNVRDSAYEDRPLPIGHGQTISQPYIVALMTQLAKPRPDSRALDVGTGSGYQAAVLGELCREVYSIEIVEELAEQASKRLARLGYENIHVRSGDGYQGWKEHEPFDLIIVAAAPAQVPKPLIEQLAPGGRMVIPVGRFQQDLMIIEKSEDGTIRQWSEIPVAFVPMTGEARQDR
jgi:protein-L-isoaspartate(D-aspartate) O-methyltransferase